MTNISYKRTKQVWKGYDDFLVSLIEKYSSKRICDIGGGANPILSLEYINNKELAYSILDISESELAKAPDEYNKITQDICTPTLPIDKEYDFIFSKMLAEHVKDGEQFHKNIHKLLCNGGIAVHFFPTLYTVPFLVNSLLPEKLTYSLLEFIMPNRDLFQRAKFPAYYRWCRGPLKKQIFKFNKIGFDVIDYIGLFGHGYYDRIKIARLFHNLKTNFLLKHPLPLFTNFAMVVLSKRQ